MLNIGKDISVFGQEVAESVLDDSREGISKEENYNEDIPQYLFFLYSILPLFCYNEYYFVTITNYIMLDLSQANGHSINYSLP